MFQRLELEDGTCISEAPCIFQYIEYLYPEPNLLGTNPYEVAEIGKWERFSEMQGGQAIGEFFRNQAEPLKNRGLPGFSDLPQIPELISRGKKELNGSTHKLMQGSLKQITSQEIVLPLQTLQPYVPLISAEELVFHSQKNIRKFLSGTNVYTQENQYQFKPTSTLVF